MNIMEQEIKADQDKDIFTSKYNYFNIPLLKGSNVTVMDFEVISSIEEIK